ncbi:hypothetical protein [Oleomonas cavernae]|nr:hypothetical protein [Oleomonas cavernae]
MPQPINLAFVRAKAGQAEELGRRLHALAQPPHRAASSPDFDIRRSAKDPQLWLVARHSTPSDLHSFISEAPALIDVSVPFEVSMST